MTNWRVSNMDIATAIPEDVSVASIGRNHPLVEAIKASGKYHVECRNAKGELQWEDTIENLVTTVGKNDILDKYLAGSAYTAAWYLGLITNTSYTSTAVGDTMASHAGWLEAGGANAPTYTGNRPSVSWGAASAGSKTSSPSPTFTIGTGGTLKGCFLTTITTKDGTTGILYSAGTFTGGDKVVSSTDVLTVTYTASMT